MLEPASTRSRISHPASLSSFAVKPACLSLGADIVNAGSSRVRRSRATAQFCSAFNPDTEIPASSNCRTVKACYKSNLLNLAARSSTSVHPSSFWRHGAHETLVHQRLDVLRGQHPDPPLICEPLQHWICESGVVSKLILHAIYCSTLNVCRIDAVHHDTYS